MRITLTTRITFIMHITFATHITFTMYTIAKRHMHHPITITALAFLLIATLPGPARAADSTTTGDTTTGNNINTATAATANTAANTTAAANATAATTPPEWIDPDTGHRVIRLSDEPGTSSLYFNQNAYTPDGTRLMVTTRDGGIGTINLKTRELKKSSPAESPPS